MKFNLFRAIKRSFTVIMLMALSLVLGSFRVEKDTYTYIVLDINKIKTVELIFKDVDYKKITKINYNRPAFFSQVIEPGEKGIVAITSYNDDPFVIKEAKDEIIEVGQANPKSFVGSLTGYGPDCPGCSGIVNCDPYVNVKQDIYFQDKTYDKVRIVAADKSIPCGTIVRISNFKLVTEPIIAIVLDRGSAIKGKIMDLLYDSEKETQKVGYQKNINYEVLRWGW